jgi:hypothetical protein
VPAGMRDGPYARPQRRQTGPLQAAPPSLRPRELGRAEWRKAVPKKQDPSRTSSSLRRGAWVVGKIRSPWTAIPRLWELGVHGSSQRPHAPIHPWIAACSTETRLITQYCLEIPEQ